MSTAPEAASGSQSQSPLLQPTGRKGRYGVSYLQNICAQAGFPFDETGADQDVQAIDGVVKLRRGAVNVQVKCSSRYPVNSTAPIAFSLERTWLDLWREFLGPVYLVMVLVPNGRIDDWIDHVAAETIHKTAAFWLKFDPQMTGLTVHIPRSNRLNMDTFQIWHHDLVAAYGVIP